MIHFDEKLPCGVELQIMQDRTTDGILVILLDPKSNSWLTSQIDGKRKLVISIGPENLPVLAPVLRKIAGNGTFWERLKNLFGVN